jgi:hypothetical protein
MAILNLNSRRHDASAQESERRTSRRRPLSDVPVISEVKVKARQAQVVNISSGGLLIEVSLRLLPGTKTQLEIVRTHGPLSISGRIVRSEVSGISQGALQYYVAIAFDRPLDFIDLKTAGETTATPTDSDEAQVQLFFSDEDNVRQSLELNAW